MTIDTNTIVSVTEANQNFSRVTRIAETNGQAVIFKNNRPKYMLVDLDNSPLIDMTDDEKIDFVAARILKKYKPAFMELQNDQILKREGLAASQAHRGGDGGSIGVRYETLLESALENVFSGFGGQEFYPTREEKGARLGYALISNHAFVDGNKRISMYVMLTFLEVNGHSVGLRQRRGCRGRSGCRLRRNGLRGAVGVGAGAPCLTQF